MEINTARFQFIHLRMNISGLFEVHFARGWRVLKWFSSMTSFLGRTFLGKFTRDESKNGNK